MNPSQSIYLLLLIPCMTLGVANASPTTALGTQTRPSELQSGGLLLRRADGLRAAPTLATDVEIKVTGLVGRTRVTQRFYNPTRDWVEAVYVFPLPEKAAVDSLKMTIGDRVLEGRVQECAKARATFEKARSEGRKASLVEQERPNIFTTTVANIGPGENVEIVLSYQEVLRYDHARFSIRFPMVVAPRYIPTTSSISGFSESGWEDTVQRAPVPDADRITPPLSNPASGRTQPVSIRVRIDAGFRLVEVESPTHPVRVRAEPDHVYEVELSDGLVQAESDFVLSWRPVVGKVPGAALFHEQWQGEHYALLMVLPPSPDPDPDAGASEIRLSKETIFVIDTSGSMGGDSIRQAQKALIHTLGQLHPEDAFNVIRFDSTVEKLYSQARPVNQASIREAVVWVSQLDARGGTEMLPALTAALIRGTERRAVRQIIFITDGAVGNESDLLRVIRRDLDRSRLYTVGIGSAPNSHFMTKAAEFGRGTFTYIASPEEVEARMGELFSKLDSPVLHDLIVEWDATGVEAWPRRIPDVYSGEPVVIAARLPAGVGQVVLTGQRGREDLRIELDVSGGSKHAGVARVWARRKVASLMNSLHEGAPVDRVSADVAELGILHHIVTRWTSLVAVDVTPTAPVDVVPEKHAVPSLLPRGWSWRTLFGGKDAPANTQPSQPAPGTGPGDLHLKQASASVISTQALASRPLGLLPMGSTPAALLLGIGSMLLGISSLLWRSGRGA